MAYFNYHATIKKLINQNKLIGYYFTNKHNNISPALVFVFDDIKHLLMPIRKHRWNEYLPLLDKEKLLKEKNKDNLC